MSEAATIGRKCWAQKVLFAAGAAISSGGRMSGIIDATEAAGGSIRIPKAWTGADISFVAATTPGGSGVSPVRGTPPVDEEFHKVRQQSGGLLALIENIVTNEIGWYPIPAEVFQAGGYFRLKSTNTGSEADMNQSAEREVWVSLKS